MARKKNKNPVMYFVGCLLSLAGLLVGVPYLMAHRGIKGKMENDLFLSSETSLEVRFQYQPRLQWKITYKDQKTSEWVLTATTSYFTGKILQLEQNAESPRIDDQVLEITSTKEPPPPRP